VAGDRKYRQPGYQDYAHEKSERGEKRRPPREKTGGARWQQAQEGGPRAPQMPGTRQVSRGAVPGLPQVWSGAALLQAVRPLRSRQPLRVQ
jgi:hypothetical protein